MSNEKVSNSRLKLVLLILIILSPIVISSFLHRWNIHPDKTVNYGELIEVTPLKGLATDLENNTIFRSRQFKGKWTLLMIDSGQCGEDCQDKLYKMRQVRLVQHVDKDKVQRIWLINDDLRPDSAIIDEYQGTRLVLAKGRDLLEEFPYVNTQADHIYVVDPMGNLMMRYAANVDPKEMVADIKRLLKLSHIEH